MDRGTKRLIFNYIAGKVNRTDAQKAVERLTNGESDQANKDLMGKIWQHELFLNRKDVEPDPQRILDHVHHMINSVHHHSTDNKFKKRIGGLSRVAAILFIPLAIYTMWNTFHAMKKGEYAAANKQYIEVYSQQGVRTKFKLPDGTLVWLNNDSKLRYPAVFGEKRRLVELDGEGYFEVTKNPQKPFIVNTKSIGIKVLGTKFNVSSYDSDQKTEVALLEGKVALLKDGTRDRPDNLISNLAPGEIAKFKKEDHKLTIVRTDVNRYIAWKEGKLVFYETPFDEIIPKVERWYNCSIILKDKAINKLHLTATFEGENLEQALNLMTMATPIKYKIIPSRKLADNSFTKRQVILYSIND